LDKDCIAGDIRPFNDKLREWEDSYNYHRPTELSMGRLRAAPGKEGPCQGVTEVLRPYNRGSRGQSSR
jgi:hypothetical protein